MLDVVPPLSLDRSRRAHEAGRLHTHVRSGLEGAAATVVVTGPAGIGKTWLVDQLVGAVACEAGPAVLRLAAHPAEQELPFAGLHQLLWPVVERIASLPPPQRDALDGALARRPVAPTDAFAVASGLHRLLTDLAELRPVLVVADDVQWLDAPTRQALHFATRRLDVDRVAVVLAARSPLRPDVRGLRTTALELEPLDDGAARAMVRHLHPTAAVPAVEAIVAAAHGLPLALAEIPAGLSSAQLRAEEDLPPILPLGTRLGDLYAGRLTDLDDRALLALLVASLEPLPLELLEATLHDLGLDLTTLDPPQRSGLITVGPAGATFPHATTAGAVQAAATASMRARAHRALATSLRGDPARRAGHLAALVHGPDAEVAAALTAAAEAAEGQGAWLTAGQAHEAAVERTTAPTGDQHRQAATAYARAGAAGPLVRVLHRLAAATCDPADRLAVEAELVSAQAWTGAVDIDVAGARALADRFGADAPAGAARLRAVVAFTLVVSGRAREAQQDLDAARSLVPQPGDADADLAVTFGLLDAYLGGAADPRPLLAWAESLTDAELALPSLPLVAATSTLVWADEPDRADDLLARQCRALRAVGAFGQVGVSEGQRAAIAQRQGDWTGAEARFVAAIDRCTDTDLVGPLPHIQLRYAYLLAAQGREEPCLELIAAARRLDPGSALFEHLADCVAGLLALGLGRTDEAVDRLERAGALERAAGINQPGYSTRAADLVEAHWRRRDRAAASSETSELTARAERWGRAGPLAAAARCRALLGPDARIDDEFEEAVGLHRTAVDVFEEARTELAWGRRLRRAQRKRDARPHLHRALEVFERSGAAPWADQARSELAACGERRVAGRSPATDLTPRELEVAVAVARGASNPEVAADLCISRRTVEDHLGRVYRKLGVRDRRALAARLLPSADS